jgi:hypothetical protein
MVRGRGVDEGAHRTGAAGETRGGVERSAQEVGASRLLETGASLGGVMLLKILAADGGRAVAGHPSPTRSRRSSSSDRWGWHQLMPFLF